MSNKPSEKNETPAAAQFDEDGFCIAEGVKRIENNTERLINLVPIENAPDFPQGIKLWPGLTTVPNRYWVALENYEPGTMYRCSQDPEMRKLYKKSTRRPGQDTINYLLTPTKIVKADGIFYGPQITVYEPEQCDRPDGAPLPDTLAQYNEPTALKIIQNVNDLGKLKSWAKTETDPRRAKVREAAQAKIASLE